MGDLNNDCTRKNASVRGEAAGGMGVPWGRNPMQTSHTFIAEIHVSTEN